MSSNDNFRIVTVGENVHFSQEINSFCTFAFGNTRFSKTLINFEDTFDPTYTRKARIQSDSDILTVQYNRNHLDSLDDILEALAHESIHAQQLSDNRLAYALIRSGNSIQWGLTWEGIHYPTPTTLHELVALPWEVEAYAGTEDILQQYNDSKNNLKKSLYKGENIIYSSIKVERKRKPTESNYIDDPMLIS